MKIKFYPCKSSEWNFIDLIPSIRLMFTKNGYRELYFSSHFLIYQLDIELRF